MLRVTRHLEPLGTSRSAAPGESQHDSRCKSPTQPIGSPMNPLCGHWVFPMFGPLRTGDRMETHPRPRRSFKLRSPTKAPGVCARPPKPNGLRPWLNRSVSWRMAMSHSHAPFSYPLEIGWRSLSSGTDWNGPSWSEDLCPSAGHRAATQQDTQRWSPSSKEA